MTAHSLTEAYCYICPQCPQKFCEERRLRNHLELHASDPNSACHRCRQCDGAFRSALALRRHIDQSRACYSHPFGIKPQMMIAPTQPIDPYAFIESDEENENKNVIAEAAAAVVVVTGIGGGGIKRQKSIGDSGAGSDVSSNTTSPPRNSTLEEEYDEKTPEDSSFLSKRSKKSSENEDADSGFRSRLNSNLSCSPSSHSAISSGSDSPGRKYSTGQDYGNGGIGASNYEALAGPSGSNASSYGNGCYSQTSTSRLNIPAPTAHYSYGLIEIEDNFGIEMDSEEDFGGQLLQKKSVSTRNFRLIQNMKANAADNEFINRISEISSSSEYSSSVQFETLNSFNGFPLETFEVTEPVIETSKELK
uniref:C2H2-type domain-containing protein n=1 Tax=Panagrolaimus superbus TaxID=310955 RepID=A0A914YQD3_9BILA